MTDFTDGVVALFAQDELPELREMIDQKGTPRRDRALEEQDISSQDEQRLSVAEDTVLRLSYFDAAGLGGGVSTDEVVASKQRLTEVLEDIGVSEHVAKQVTQEWQAVSIDASYELNANGRASSR